MKKDNFTALRVVMAVMLLFIPLILFFVNGMHFEKSISAHAYTNPIAFATCLTFGVSLLIYDGFVDIGNYYNVWIGLALLGVIIFGCYDYQIIHYTFAGAFFLGSFANMVLFSSKKFRKYIWLVIAITAVTMISSIPLGGNSFILIVEWIGLLPISAYLIFKAIGKIY